MTIDIEIEILSLSFLWAFSAVFCIALYLSYRRVQYSYLRLAVATLIADLIKQAANDLTIPYPIAPFYAVSSIAFFAESLLFLATVASAYEKPIGRRTVAAAAGGYIASLAFMYLAFDPKVSWHWFASYMPALALHGAATWFAWRLFRDRFPASGWLLASSVSVLGTRIALPWLSPTPTMVYGFTYFSDGILFALTLGTIMLIALEQMASERQRSLDERRQAESTIRFLLDNTEDVIISHGEDGTILSWNNRAQAMFGYSDRDAVGTVSIDQLLMPAEDHEGTRRETIAFTADQRSIPVEVSARHARDSDQVHHTLVIRDLSAFREIEARHEQLSDQLREVQKLESLGALAAGIAHDFNNLLASIMGHAEIATKQLAAPVQARHAIDQVLTAASRASELTEQMLTYAGKAEFHPRPLDLNATIQEIVALMSASINPRADFELDLVDNRAWISADRAQVTQVLINLISNASDALSGRDGTIHISTKRRSVSEEEIRAQPLGEVLSAGDYVVMRVHDDGDGMPEEVRRRVFEPFFSTKFTGRGLGLAAVAGIVKKHQGAVSVASQVGEGTAFTFYFPAHEREFARVKPKGHEDYVPLTRNLATLVVDDNEDLLDLCERILDSSGHRTIRARSGEEAIQLARHQKPDVVIMDCNMPGKAGPEIYRALLDEGILAPVIFITGLNLSRIRERLEPHWPATLLKKPFLANELLEALDLVSDRETSVKGLAHR